METAKSQTHSLFRGRPAPLGATLYNDGVNFALFSENAEKVYLCLFDKNGKETHLELLEQTYKVWHGFVPGIKAGQHYGFRVHGPWDPENGLRFNKHKLLLDPYAKATSGPVIWDHAVYSYIVENPNEGRSFDERDSAPFMPRAIVVDNKFDWGNDSPPNTAWNDTVIYEAHVKGFTKLMPEVPPEHQGTYTGLAHPAVIGYLKDLGITAIELLPIQQFVEEEHLQLNGLKNYWGYNTIGYFAPEWRYATNPNNGSQVQEFKSMVKAMHAAGIEVILDVVYNHTAEGNHLGPTLSFKGIDNQAYYRAVVDEPGMYMDYTGCGNTLNVINPHALRLIMDSLRYWVTEMHVDGFRFDLASALARGFHEVNQLNSFFGILYQDPILSEVKLIAEPWDLGEGGYQVGNFPDHWSEWNDKYRDTVRAFWKGDDGLIADLGYRLMGSNDLYGTTGRGPTASINFITAHDGFCLNDLVSYNGKHNERNLEENRDGNDNNHSFNWGVEGPTDDANIKAVRESIKRSFLATLFLSQGVPMLVAGDEMGRTQDGNNNAYCQDNELSWISWQKADRSLIDFTRNLIKLRREHRVFHRRNFFEGESLRPGGKKDVMWFLPNGQEMTEDEWKLHHSKCLALELTGTAIHEHNEKNELICDDNFIWLLNASSNGVEYQFSDSAKKYQWEIVFDTSREWPKKAETMDPGKRFVISPHSTVLFIQKKPNS
jgi:glycogen debranching enzyme GlgX